MSEQSGKIDTVIVAGLELAQALRADMAAEVARETESGRRPPCLAVVLVGDDPASASYIKGKRRACARLGFDSLEHKLPGETTQAELLALVRRLGAAEEVDGILVQLPLPAQIDPGAVAEAIPPEKDVDGVGPLNAGLLMTGGEGLFPCTPLGIMEILDRHHVELTGQHAVVVGRSTIVGKPVSLLLQRKNATVTMCHSRTQNLAEMCRSADVLIACAGVPRLVQGDWIKPGAAVIDVGATHIDGEPVGDVDFEAALGRAALLTPHRRGVGPMTITMLLQNTLRAWRKRGAP